MRSGLIYLLVLLVEEEKKREVVQLTRAKMTTRSFSATSTTSCSSIEVKLSSAYEVGQLYLYLCALVQGHQGTPCVERWQHW